MQTPAFKKKKNIKFINKLKLSFRHKNLKCAHLFLPTLSQTLFFTTISLDIRWYIIHAWDSGLKCCLTGGQGHPTCALVTPASARGRDLGGLSGHLSQYIVNIRHPTSPYYTTLNSGLCMTKIHNIEREPINFHTMTETI